MSKRDRERERKKEREKQKQKQENGNTFRAKREREREREEANFSSDDLSRASEVVRLNEEQFFQQISSAKPRRA